MKIGVIREGKVPPDARVPLIPAQCAQLRNDQNLDLVVQPSPIRIYADSEYREAGVPLQEDMQDRDLLLGVKEVPIEQLIPGKTYCFFSHTHKKQAYNRDLLRAVLDKNVRLVDYEVITGDQGRRLIAFGYFAGVVGAHNGLWAYAQRTGQFTLPRMNDLHDYAAAKAIYAQLQLPPMKIVLTGTGRVASGAARVLEDMGIEKVGQKDFLHKTFKKAVFTQLDCRHYARRKDGEHFEKKHFYKHPEMYENAFTPYTRVADLMINGIYWDNKAPAFFTAEDMRKADWNIKVIADVTCDIAPVASIPSTLKASTIAEPVFGYDPQSEAESEAYQDNHIDMMTIDNLPSELPRDASQAFGEMFMQYVLPEFLKENSKVIERATIAKDGQLGKHFQYLSDFVEGKE